MYKKIIFKNCKYSSKSIFSGFIYRLYCMYLQLLYISGWSKKYRLCGIAFCLVTTIERYQWHTEWNKKNPCINLFFLSSLYEFLLLIFIYLIITFCKCMYINLCVHIFQYFSFVQNIYLILFHIICYLLIKLIKNNFTNKKSLMQTNSFVLSSLKIHIKKIAAYDLEYGMSVSVFTNEPTPTIRMLKIQTFRFSVFGLKVMLYTISP